MTLSVRRNRSLTGTVLLWVSLIVLAVSAPVLAQLGAGTIEGTILDATGAVIPDAKVTVKNIATGAERILTTDSTGHYRAVTLPPGIYSVKAEKGGFQTTEHTNVQVGVGATTAVDITLAVAKAAETVVVTESAPVIDTEKTDVSSTISETVVSNVPVIGRRFDNYVLLAPTVATDGNFGLITYRGISGLYNNNTVDGADNNQAFFSEARGRTRAVYTYSQASVKEFQVGISNFNAEYGRAAGGLVNAVTKSGTNAFHGEAFYFLRDDFTSAREPTIPVSVVQRALGVNTKVLPERRQQFGFAMGGPVKKDKLFWFLTYDQQVRGFPYVVNFNSDQFIALCPGTFVVTTTACVPPTVLKVPVSDCSVLTDVNQRATCNFFFTERTVVPRRALNNVILGRIDWTVNQDNNIAVYYNWHLWRSVNGIRTPAINFNAAGDNGFDSVRDGSFFVRWNSVLSPRLVNEFRFQFARDNEVQRPNVPGPGTSPTNGFSFGMPNFLPRSAFPFEKRFQFVENLSFLKGKHTFKLGADVNYVRDRQINLFQGGGVYSYSNFPTLAGDCPANAVPLGCVPDGVPSYSSYTQAFDRRVLNGSLPPALAGFAFFVTTDYNLFAQDTFKVTPHLTFNYGIRYEYQALPQPDAGNPLLPLTQHFNQDKNNLAPRLGLSWDIGKRHRTVVRTGFGVTYGRTSNSAIASGLLNNGVVITTLRFVPATAGRPVYPNCFQPATNSPCTLPTPSLSGPSAQLPNINQLSADFRRPNINQAEFSLEHEIFKDTTVSATYAYSGGHHLPLFRDVNMPPPANVFFVNLTNDLVVNSKTLVPAGVYGPFPFYCNATGAGANTPVGSCPTAITGTVIAPNGRPNGSAVRIVQEESVVNSSYHALIVRVNRRMRNGLLFDSHFTWAKSIDNGQNSQTFFAGGSTDFDPLNAKLDRARSDFDIRKRFVTSFVWQPGDTFHPAGNMSKHLLNGWSLSGVVTLQSGKPVSPFLSGFLTSGCAAIASSCPIDTGNANGSGGTFRFPFVGRNIYDAPGFSNLDFRVSRSLGLGESRRIELIVESFNLFNHPNFTVVNTTAFSQGTNVKNVGVCGTATITMGNRCLTASSATDFLNVRTASSTLSGARDFQFAIKFYW